MSLEDHLDFFNTNTNLDGVAVNSIWYRKGDRVRVRPKSGADIIDMAIAGKTAIIQAIEQDVEDRIFVALVLDDDPGRDLGLMRQPGHLFFYTIDEVERLDENETPQNEAPSDA